MRVFFEVDTVPSEFDIILLLESLVLSSGRLSITSEDERTAFETDEGLTIVLVIVITLCVEFPQRYSVQTYS